MSDQPPILPTTTNARIFVLVELCCSVGAIAVGFIMGVLVWRFNGGMTLGVIVWAVVAGFGMWLHLVLMTYRFISYLLMFLSLAGMMDRTRMLLTSLFAPGRKTEV